MSSSNSQAQDQKSRKIHEVFLSFRGEDTRESFTKLLFDSLLKGRIHVFMDDHSLKRGDHISTTLLQAIEQSEISIIVFSRNYANSGWCLDELVKIMECHRTMGQIVLPVFYDVDDFEVLHQTGEFGKAFQSLLSKTSEEEDASLKWRDALCDAANLPGFVVQNTRDSINHIVEKVGHLLDKMEFPMVDNPVGVESRVQDIIQLLGNQQSNDVLVLGVWGMGGLGKTTIVKAIYNKIGRNFEVRSFIANIGGKWEKKDEQVVLKARLYHKKVLLVLDDVNSLDQLNVLYESRKWFGSGSIIIITTRDKHILSGNRVDKIYTMKEMDGGESIELFSWHAFRQASPREDFTVISKKIVEYSGGLPLALETLGTYLFERGVAEWKSELDKLKIIPNNEVHRKLKVSYDRLDDDVKDIFLDIACFFIGMDQNDVIHILNGCGHYAEIGISILVEQSLVTVDDKNKLGMHNLLRDMGREIIRENSPSVLKERSRLWFDKDVLGLLSNETGSKVVEGLTFKFPIASSKCFSTKAFKKMTRLRLLQLAGVQLDGDFEYLSRNLRWLSWNGFPLTCIPTSFYQGNLVSIELENSNIRHVWKETQMMKMLKILNLSHSHYLTETPDFSNLPNLEKLVLADCLRLSEVSPSIGNLSEILLIDLEDCVSLRSLPRSIYKLKSLQTLILSGCLMIDKLEEDLEHMESLTTLLANNTAINCLPSRFQTSTLTSSPVPVPLDVPHSFRHWITNFMCRLVECWGK